MYQFANDEQMLQRFATQHGTQADQPNRGHFGRPDAQYRPSNPSATFGWLA
jgi:hypothetical protein